MVPVAEVGEREERGRVEAWEGTKDLRLAEVGRSSVVGSREGSSSEEGSSLSCKGV